MEIQPQTRTSLEIPRLQTCSICEGLGWYWSQEVDKNNPKRIRQESMTCQFCNGNKVVINTKRIF